MIHFFGDVKNNVFAVQTSGEISEKNIKKLSTEDISKVAELHAWYDTVYALTSTAVHTSARSLESHLVTNDNNEAIVSFHNEPHIHGIGLPLAIGVNSMHIATDAICDIIGKKRTEENEDLNARYEKYYENRA